MKILVLDNYDSFTYNLVHYMEEIGGFSQMDVIRNDAITLDEVAAYDAIVLSPGPGVPAEAGIMPELIARYAGSRRILGVCLGHQAIAEAFNTPIYNLDEVLHGVPKKTIVIEEDDYLFKNVPKEFMAGRYHSWVADEHQLSVDLVMTATDPDGRVMALRHKKFDIRGLQFHPESILTEHGKQLIRNWLEGPA